MSDLRLRLLAEKDRPRARRLAERLPWSPGWKAIAEAWDTGQVQLYGAYAGDELVGWFSATRTGAALDVVHLAFEPGYFLGHGADIARQLLELARSWGCETILGASPAPQARRWLRYLAAAGVEAVEREIRFEIKPWAADPPLPAPPSTRPRSLIPGRASPNSSMP